MEIVLGVKVPPADRERIHIATHVPMPMRLSWDASLPNAGQWDTVLRRKSPCWDYAWTVTDAPTMEVLQERLGQYMAANKIDNAVEAWVNAMACDLGGRWPKNAFNKRGLWDKWHPGERYRKSWHYFMWGLPRPHCGESLLKIMRCAALFCCYDIIRDSSPLHTVSHGVNEARNAARKAFGEYASRPEVTEDALLEALELLRQRARIALLMFSIHHRPPAGTFKRLYDMMNKYYDAVVAPRDWKEGAETRSIGLKFFGEEGRVIRVAFDDEVREVLLPRCVLRFTETRARTWHGGKYIYRFQRTFTVQRDEMDESKAVAPGVVANIFADGSATILRGGTVVEPFLHLLQMDPEGVIHQVGKAVGHCALCGKPITTDISRARGLGPECYRLADQLLGDQYKYDITAQLGKVPGTENDGAPATSIKTRQAETEMLRIKSLDGKVVVVKDIVRRHSAFLLGFGDDIQDPIEIEMPIEMAGDHLRDGLGLVADLLFYVNNALITAPCLAWPQGTFMEAESLVRECLRIFCPNVDTINASIRLYEWLMVTFSCPGTRRTDDAAVLGVMIEHLIRANLA